MPVSLVFLSKNVINSTLFFLISIDSNHFIAFTFFSQNLHVNFTVDQKIATLLLNSRTTSSTEHRVVKVPKIYALTAFVRLVMLQFQTDNNEKYINMLKHSGIGKACRLAETADKKKLFRHHLRWITGVNALIGLRLTGTPPLD